MTMKTTTTSRSLVAAAALLVLAVAGHAAAAPPLGSPRPAARVVDADGAALDLRQIPAKPILVLYEDKESAMVNVALKEELSRLAKGDRYRTAIALIPVADVESYDFWPARGFVKSAIRSESKKIGATIYCDWDGSFRRATRLAKNTSSVMLIGRDGRVQFVYEGSVPKQERERLLAMLRAEVEGRGPAT